MKISAAIATFNEEDNIGPCLESVVNLVDEIVVVDGSSTDRTVEIAKSFGAKVEIRPNHPIFHINKQRSFDLTNGDWILYLDADERVSPALAKEIKQIIAMSDQELEQYQLKLKNRRLFLRHQMLLEDRDGRVGDLDGQTNAFFIPRLNFFLGKYLRYGGVYPDGVIRLFRKGKAYLPCKDVHEQMVVSGKVGWLDHDLYHIDSPTFKRYLDRNSRYIDLIANQLSERKLAKNLVTIIDYNLVKPIDWLLKTLFRHKGILDGWQGIVFSIFSSLRFPRAYWRYWSNFR